jgi:hypothetical protein
MAVFPLYGQLYQKYGQISNPFGRIGKLYECPSMPLTSYILAVSESGLRLKQGVVKSGELRCDLLKGIFG